jgi:hypothetical protein
LERAKQYPDLLRIIEEKVKPERAKLKDSIPIRTKLKKFWWQFGSPASQLYRAIAYLKRVLVRSRVSELHMLAFVPKGYIYGDATVVLLLMTTITSHYCNLMCTKYGYGDKHQALSRATATRPPIALTPSHFHRWSINEWRLANGE